MNVRELNQEQLDQLKAAYAYDSFYNDKITWEEYLNYEEIPNDVIFECYEGITFVADDFFD